LTHHTRGNVYLDLGKLDDAEREIELAREMRAKSGRTKHDELDESLARLEQERAAAAR
jgi:hypothetical protein